MKVQEYLRNKNDPLEALATLKEEIGIRYKVYEEDGIVILDYDQIESPKTHPIVIECRSLILSYPEFDVVSRKYDRFFNYGEAPDMYADFSFDDAIVMEKADGSLIGVYYNPKTDRWEISTRGMAKAEGEHLFGGTWRQKVQEAFGFKDEVDFQERCDDIFRRSSTYIFEYCSPENRIVTKYDEAHMVLTGVRCKDGTEVDAVIISSPYVDAAFRGLRVRAPKIYSAENMDELVEYANSLPDLEEGFVVRCQKTNKRVKIKSKTYLVAHKLRGNDAVPTRKNVLTLVLEGEVDEFLAYFPEWKGIISTAQSEVDELLADAMIYWEKAKSLESQKEFALVVKSAKAPWILFSARKNGTIPSVEFHKADLNQKLKTLGV